jgi:hypothetical protein
MASMTKPSVGRTVLVQTDPASNNGADVAPAVVSRVNDDGTVNVRVLNDWHSIDWRQNLEIHDKRPDDAGNAAWWPPRV